MKKKKLLKTDVKCVFLLDDYMDYVYEKKEDLEKDEEYNIIDEDEINRNLLFVIGKESGLIGELKCDTTVPIYLDELSDSDIIAVYSKSIKEVTYTNKNDLLKHIIHRFVIENMDEFDEDPDSLIRS